MLRSGDGERSAGATDKEFEDGIRIARGWGFGETRPEIFCEEARRLISLDDKFVSYISRCVQCSREKSSFEMSLVASLPSYFNLSKLAYEDMGILLRGSSYPFLTPNPVIEDDLRPLASSPRTIALWTAWPLAIQFILSTSCCIGLKSLVH